jgi:hypothetical protein
VLGRITKVVGTWRFSVCFALVTRDATLCA